MQQYHETQTKTSLSKLGSGKGIMWRTLASLIVVLFLVQIGLSDRTWAAKTGDTESGTTQLVRGAASWLVGAPYTAFKLGFAVLGVILGSVTYVATGGNEEAAQKVWDSSLRGTYILTPDHLKGDRPVEFIGQMRREPTVVRTEQAG